MYLFLYILTGLITGLLIDSGIIALFEGIKKLTKWLTDYEPDEDTFANMTIVIYNIAIVFITVMVSIILYFVIN